MNAPPLKELAGLKQAFRRHQAERRAAQQRAEARARAAAEAARLQAQAGRVSAQDAQLFARSVGAVHSLPDSGRVLHTGLPRPEPLPTQRDLDEAAALREALSDEVDVESLLLTDDGLSFRRPGIGPDVLTKLRRGQWTIQAQIDLHGLRRDEAREALQDFLRRTRQAGQRCVRVVHGKGLGSPGREPVLKGRVQRWLAQVASVQAFTQASGPQGGAGALIVLLSGD